MKKLKQRVTLKKRRRNKMRHSHRMQQGGFFTSAKIALQERKYEKMPASEILKLPDNTLPEYLIIIADKNLKDKILRDSKTIFERTKNSWKATNYKNWAKGDDELDNKIMEYFTAYNKIAQILVKQKINELTSIKEGDARIKDVANILFDFFCKYISVISKVLISDKISFSVFKSISRTKYNSCNLFLAIFVLSVATQPLLETIPKTAILSSLIDFFIAVVT